VIVPELACDVREEVDANERRRQHPAATSVRSTLPLQMIRHEL
jgi:hypothetical protein